MQKLIFANEKKRKVFQFLFCILKEEFLRLNKHTNFLTKFDSEKLCFLKIPFFCPKEIYYSVESTDQNSGISECISRLNEERTKMINVYKKKIDRNGKLVGNNLNMSFCLKN